jgi:amino acid transporter
VTGSDYRSDTRERATANQARLKREIGLFTLVAIGVGSIIGSGMFAMPAVMGSVAGPALLLAVVLTQVSRLNVHKDF